MFSRPSISRQILITSGFMLFFWAIYDGIISYLVPIFISGRGFNNATVGLLISLSAVAGAVFDILISKYIRSTHYLRYFIFVFLISFSLPLVLWSASNIAAFTLAMALWGLSYDLLNFGVLDLAARISQKGEHTQKITIITSFKSVGYMIGPPLIAFLITLSPISIAPIPAPYLFLVISIVLYVVVFIISSSTAFDRTVDQSSRPIKWLREIKLWRQLGHILLPVLVFNIAFYIFEATFWTLGPIFSQQFPDSKYFSGLFMVIYILPSLLAVGFAEKITERFGKKRTAYISFAISSLFLLPIGLINQPVAILLLVSISTIAGSLSFSAISGAFVDYLSESEYYDNEIIGLKDFSSNVGYIIGPVLSGIISDLVGISFTFTILGIFNICLILVLLFVTPRHITIPD